MVVVTFKLSELGRVELTLAGPERWEAVLKRCSAQSDIDPGSVISVRGGTVLRQDDLVKDGDSVDVFPAISGG